MRIHLNTSFYLRLIREIKPYARGSKVLNALDSFLVPNLCFGCKVQLYRGENFLCAFCRNELPLTELDMDINNPVSQIFRDQPNAIPAFALCYFESGGIIQKLIHQLKYQGKQSIGDWLGLWCGNQLAHQKLDTPFHWVLPVPLHPKKQRKRGYNQCERFGKRIAACIGATYSEKILIRRVFQTTQTDKDKENRYENIRDAFALVRPELLLNTHILLVDDVITTGATLSACCKALQVIPGIRISIVSMAVVP